MQWLVRFRVKEKFIDKNVTISNAYKIYKKMKKKHGYADLILIDEKGIEHCCM